MFRYDSDGKWTSCGKLGDIDTIGGMVVFRGELYATSMYSPAGMFRYGGDHEWFRCPVPRDGGRASLPLVSSMGICTARASDKCAIYRFDSNEWGEGVELEPKGQVYSFEVHAGELYAGTWPNGHVYRSSDGERWIDAGRLGDEKEVMGMAVHNGKLYAGTLPMAEAYRFDGGTAWQLTGRLDHTQDVRYRRARSMAIFQGRLFCGTLPSGHVHVLNAGAGVSYDRQLEPGWRHLAAVRQNDRLQLFVDGELVAMSSPFEPSVFDITNDQPLKIGFGAHDYFRGSLSDLRLYGQALTNDQIADLSTFRRGIERQLTI